MEEFTIIPIRVGGFKGVPKTVYTYFLDFDKQLDSAIIMYLVKGRDKLLLVDTGGGDEEWCAKHHRVISRPPDEAPVAALKKMGVAPEDIDIVVNTHLHWDHCFNNELFGKAKIYVQQRELQCAIDPLPTQAEFYEAHQVGMTPQWLKVYNRIISLDGDTKLFPGVELVTIPGHTPGMQGVLVNTAGGRYLLASDTLGLFENWEGKGRYKHIPSGIHYDLVEYHKTFEKIERICDHILPGHDPLVFRHKTYPA
ncbi:MAG: N-acyl homoserine lactonase family protein [Candidatus Korobacteraceae bacterium]|jgi:glyoxylase-like metal-dependent hydrolase (beta-lactamase superfamily II)